MVLLNTKVQYCTWVKVINLNASQPQWRWCSRTHHNIKCIIQHTRSFKGNISLIGNHEKTTFLESKKDKTQNTQHMELMNHCILLHGELVNILCALSFCTACHIVEEFWVIYFPQTQLTTNLKQLNELLQCTVKPSGENNSHTTTSYCVWDWFSEHRLFLLEHIQELYL